MKIEKIYMKTLFSIIILLCLIPILFAQENKITKFDENDAAWLQVASFAYKRANENCQALESMREFNKVAADIQMKIEKKYPGFTVDWNTLALIEKKVK